MNGFNRSYMYRSTESEKKGRKVKNQRGDACKCFPPFVKLHYHNCPAVMAPCPIHGNFFHQKEEREQNVIVSFHPSTKTERLLQPIKNLLAHCNSETKINFQYYSPENSTSKESVKGQNTQTAYENLKKSLNNNIFVEKTKSFVANKTNKVKKLRHCFHSPCNSIAQKTRSQTSIKEKINQILREEAKQTKNVFYNLVPEMPPDEKKYEPAKLFGSTKGGFNHPDFLSAEKLDSDFITVTQQDKNNTIHHKIFEIKHRKGLNDIPFVGFPKQPNQLVYSTVNVTSGPVNETAGYTYERYDQKRVNYERSRREDVEETGKSIELCSSEKTNRSVASTSSSGSVYITPFIFVPKGMEDSDTEMKSKLRRIDVMEEGVQVEDSCICKPKPETPNETKTPPPSSKKSLVPVPSPERTAVEEPKCKTVILQTDSFQYEERVCRSSRIVIHDYEPDSATKMEEIYMGSGNAVMARNYDEDSYRRSFVSRRTPDSVQNTRTTEIQTGSGYREVLITARCYSGMRDKTSQTDDLWNVQVSVKTFDSRTNKSQASEPYTTAPQVSEKGIQTASIQSAPDEPEFIELNSPNVTYVIKPFEEQDSDQTIDKLAKTWWGKSRSDSDLYERLKCVCCKTDQENANLPSNLPDGNKSPAEKSTVSKVYESGAVSRALSGAPSGAENYSKAGNVTLRTRETVERFSDSKQTSTREEELSAAVSDLSELKKIIQEFFEKGNLSSKKTCECDKSVTKAAKMDKGTMTDPASVAAKPEQKAPRNLVDRAVQTILDFLPKFERKSTSAREVQTLQETENKNAFVQTYLEKNEVQVQTSAATVKDDKEVQTNSEVLLGETEQKKADNQTKNFLVCSVCGRDMKNSTNTSGPFSPSSAQQTSERQPKTKMVNTGYIETYEVKMRTKKVQQNPDSSKKSIVGSTQTSDDNQRAVKPQAESPRGGNSQNSRIPVPYPSTYVRFRNNETVVQKNTEIFCPDWMRKNYQTEASQSHVATTYRDCICETVAPSTSKGQKQSVDESTSTKTKGKKLQPKSENRREQMEASSSGRKSAPGGQPAGNKQRHNLDYMFPVLVTPFGPKEFMKTWKSMENSMSDIPSSDDSKSQSSKQKRSSERGLEAAAGKKIKVDVKQPSKEYLPDLPDFLRQGHVGDIKIWPSNFMLYQPKTPEDSTGTDEQIAKKHSLENNEDFPLESEHFSDSNNTPTENSFFGDEEEEEPGEQPFDGFSRKAPELRPHSHSVVTFNSSLFPDDTATSKSVNAFWCFLNSKKTGDLVEKIQNERPSKRRKKKKTEKHKTKKN